MITAFTGSGKTLPAEEAIKYYHLLGKKSIYCSPVKALTNEKLSDNEVPRVNADGPLFLISSSILTFDTESFDSLFNLVLFVVNNTPLFGNNK